MGKKRPPRNKEWIENQSIAHKGKQRGKNNPFYGKHHTDEVKQKIRETRLKTKYPVKDTSIEIALQKPLKQKGFLFKKHITVCGICQPDVVFPSKKIAIFADGDYWHSKIHKGGKAWEKDRNQDRVLSENGWRVIRFWGSEIKNNTENCVNKIISVVEGQ